MSLLSLLANAPSGGIEVTLAPTEFDASGSLTADLTPEGFSNLAAIASFTIGGLLYERNPDIGDQLFRVAKYVGNEPSGQDIRRLRRSAYELFRRMGQPVIVKPMLTTEDFETGAATHSPNYDDVYGQTRNEDPFSFGTGFVSAEPSVNEWYGPDGVIVTANSSPGSTYTQAPLYRGYGPGFITYIIEPDAPVDAFQLSPAGALIRIQSPTVVAPWYPTIHDNDLVINVELGPDGRVAAVHERYIAGTTSPVSIRGNDRLGRRENENYGNRNVVNQLLRMTLVPENNILQYVPIDR